MTIGEIVDKKYKHLCPGDSDDWERMSIFMDSGWGRKKANKFKSEENHIVLGEKNFVWVVYHKIRG
jgi:hypothetical protein